MFFVVGKETTKYLLTKFSNHLHPLHFACGTDMKNLQRN